jgi:hypothetical protein
VDLAAFRLQADLPGDDIAAMGFVDFLAVDDECQVAFMSFPPLVS